MQYVCHCRFPAWNQPVLHLIRPRSPWTVLKTPNIPRPHWLDKSISSVFWGMGQNGSTSKLQKIWMALDECWMHLLFQYLSIVRNRIGSPILTHPQLRQLQIRRSRWSFMVPYSQQPKPAGPLSTLRPGSLHVPCSLLHKTMNIYCIPIPNAPCIVHLPLFTYQTG